MKTGYLTLIFALACAACTPRFYPPKVDVPDGYLYGEGFPRDTAALASDWWRLFGATVLDNAVVASGCSVAAGALVLSGAKLVPNSVYAGVPARKVKEITPEQREEIILRIARDYRMYASWYEEGK